MFYNHYVHVTFYCVNYYFIYNCHINLIINKTMYVKGSYAKAYFSLISAM